MLYSKFDSARMSELLRFYCNPIRVLDEVGSRGMRDQREKRVGSNATPSLIQPSWSTHGEYGGGLMDGSRYDIASSFSKEHTWLGTEISAGL